MSEKNDSDRKDETDVLGSIIIIIIVVLVTTTTLNYSSQTARSSSTSTTASSAIMSPWISSTSYPSSIWLSSCVTSGGYIYCVGGLKSASLSEPSASVYYAKLSSTGLSSPWTNTTNYPEAIRAESCVSSSSHIYCVAGYGTGLGVDSVYFATLSSSGVGQWTNTTSYPLNVGTLSCAASATGIYCVGGTTSRGNPTNATYFAPFSSSGLGAWSMTTSYPIPIRQESCGTTATYLYCVGGYQSRSVYLAHITSSGLGQWTNTTIYPLSGAANLLSCAAQSNTVYCVGGNTGSGYSDAVFHASLSSTGVGQWVAGPNYPVALWGEYCVESSGALYCVGGETSSAGVTGEVSFAGTP